MPLWRITYTRRGHQRSMTLSGSCRQVAAGLALRLLAKEKITDLTLVELPPNKIPSKPGWPKQLTLKELK